MGRVRLFTLHKHQPLWFISLAVLLLGLLPMPLAEAATDSSGFSLQVSPSPLIATLEPGKTTDLELRIRNTSTQNQSLKMGLRSFSVSSSSGEVSLGNGEPSDAKDFVRFSSPLFTVAPGELYTQTLHVALPASAGFTYSFATTIAQQHPPKATKGNTTINGSVAVFTLLSVNRPGATRKLQLANLSVARRVYEYLPAAVTVKLKNSGNTLIQPKGSIYIQRHSDDTQPLAAIDLNPNGGYILPGSSRSLSVQWKDGFPRYETKASSDGTTKQKLTWDAGDFTKLRFGRYVAKVVAVYDDGGHDVPLKAEVTFWVIPWRILLFVLLFVAVCIVGLVTIIRKSGKAFKRPMKRHASDEK